MRPPNIFEVLLLGKSPDCGMETQGCEGAQNGYFLFITLFILSILSALITLRRKKAKRINTKRAWSGIVLAVTIAVLSGAGVVYSAIDLHDSLSTEEDVRLYERCLEQPYTEFMGETVRVACEY